MNEGAELQVVNYLFAFDTVRNKSVSLFGTLNLDHFTWGLGGAVAIECHLLIFRAVSGFRHWSAAVAFKQIADMSVRSRSKAFFGWEDYQSFSFQSNPEIQDAINSTLFYPSVTAQGSMLYFMGNLVAGDILSSGFSTCC